MGSHYLPALIGIMVSMFFVAFVENQAKFTALNPLHHALAGSFGVMIVWAMFDLIFEERERRRRRNAGLTVTLTEDGLRKLANRRKLKSLRIPRSRRRDAVYDAAVRRLTK